MSGYKLISTRGGIFEIAANEFTFLIIAGFSLVTVKFELRFT
jgi:hypothetical protein